MTGYEFRGWRKKKTYGKRDFLSFTEPSERDRLRDPSRPISIGALFCRHGRHNGTRSDRVDPHTTRG